MAGQVQVGGVTVQTPDTNPLGSVLSGVATGADWAMKNYELQQKSESLEAQRQKNLLAAMKAKADVNEKVWERAKGIIKMPNSKFKKANVELLKADLGQLGMQLHPVNEALLMDPTYETDLSTAFQNIDAADPVKRMQSLDVVRNVLGDEKFLSLMQGVNNEAGKDRRTMVSALATASEKGAQRDFQADLKKMELNFKNDQDERDRKFKVENREDQQRFEGGEKSADREVRKYENKQKLIDGLKTDADAIDKRYQPMISTFDTVEALVKKSGGYVDKVLMGRFQSLREGVQSVLREGEIKDLKSATGIVGRVENFFGGLIDGQSLTREQKSQLGTLSKQMRKITNEAVRNSLSASWDRAKSQGLPVREVFSPAMIKIMNEGGAAPSKESSAPQSAPLTPRPAPSPAPAAAQSGLSPAQAQAGKALMRLAGSDINKAKAYLVQIEQKIKRSLTPAERAAIGFQGGQ